MQDSEITSFLVSKKAAKENPEGAAEEKKEELVTAPSGAAVATFTALLQQSPDTKAACIAWFRACADAILNCSELVVAGSKIFRFIEMEVYYNDHKNHQDTFIHGTDLQKNTAGHWYFHTGGASITSAYKGGSYKGLDLTFGVPGKIPGGFLLRAMEEVATGEVIEGPCMLVDRLLKENKKAAIVDMVKSPGFTLCATDTNPFMQIRPSANLKRVIIGSPRVGLTLKRSDDYKEHFVMMPYRLTSLTQKIKKQRLTIILALKDQGYSVPDIVKISGATKGHTEGYLQALEEEAAKTKVPKDWNGLALNPAALTGLFAACQRAGATKPPSA